MRKCFAMLGVALCCLLTGCQAMEPLEDLYQLPQLPAEYTQLEAQIDGLLQAGAQYSAPISGSNLQAVQMVDLDGDGNQEAVAFLQNDSLEKPLQVHIFDNDHNTFKHQATISGSGMQIYSVAYQDFNQDGRLELVVGWRVSPEVQALSVYELRDDGPRELMTSDYVRYTMADLDGDGVTGVVVLHTDSEGQGDGLADVYQWRDEGFVIASSVSLSMTMGELSQQGRVSQGKLQDGQSAIFVTGVTSGGMAVVDVLTWQEEMLKNVVLSAQSGLSSVISPYRSLYPTDMDGNGVAEVPVAVALPSLYADMELVVPTEYCIDWTSFDTEGQGRVTMTTYHQADQGWYLVLPEQWRDAITVERRTVDAEESAVVFYRMVNDEFCVAEAFLRISYLTGDNREYNAVSGNRCVLSRQTNTIITAEFYEANENWDTPLTEDEVRNAFYTITAEWTPGES